MNNKISNEKIDKIKELRKEGRTYSEIEKIVNVTRATVYKYCKQSSFKKITKKDIIIELILSGKSIKEIEIIVSASQSYIRLINDEVKSKKKVEKLVGVREKSIDDEEINLINQKHEEKKREENIYYENQLEDEIEIMEERYPYMFKFTKL